MGRVRAFGLLLRSKSVDQIGAFTGMTSALTLEWIFRFVVR